MIAFETVLSLLSRHGCFTANAGPLFLRLVVLLALAFVTFVRLRLCDMPLERDEGEYAYVAHLLLQGEPPYESVYTMKLPGVSLICAAAMIILGESASALRIVLWIVNVVSIISVFYLGRRLLDAVAGTVAAVSFALTTLSPSVLGLAAHASHFVLMFALLGTFFLLRAIESGKLSTVVVSGIMFGFAFVMKQPGLFFGIFALAYLGLRTVTYSGCKMGPALKRMGSFTLGLAAPFVAICVVLLMAQAFERFWFWTFSYAREYASTLSFTEGIRVFRVMLGQVAVGNFFFAILALFGAGMLWWEPRLQRQRVFITGFVLASVVALLPGMYFRHHYFVFVLPAVALLSGVAVSRGWYLLGRDASIELLLTPVTTLLFFGAVAYALIIHAPVWFAGDPVRASKLVYRSSVFSDSVQVANYIRSLTKAGDRIAVLGSEPQIYFYARRQAATGYLYMYPLMEPQPFASRMQDELIRELERAKPEYVVFVNMHASWLRRPESERKIFDWWDAYSRTNYVLLRIFTPTAGESDWDPEDFIPYFLGDYSIPTEFLTRTLQPNETIPLAFHVYSRRSDST